MDIFMESSRAARAAAAAAAGSGAGAGAGGSTGSTASVDGPEEGMAPQKSQTELDALIRERDEIQARILASRERAGWHPFTGTEGMALDVLLFAWVPFWGEWGWFRSRLAYPRARVSPRKVPRVCGQEQDPYPQVLLPGYRLGTRRWSGGCWRWMRGSRRARGGHSANGREMALTFRVHWTSDGVHRRSYGLHRTCPSEHVCFAAYLRDISHVVYNNIYKSYFFVYLVQNEASRLGTIGRSPGNSLTPKKCSDLVH